MRSIPARAGEPVGAGHCRCSREVYPRACGGTIHAPNNIKWKAGLSPRVRGNPGLGRPCSLVARVYPRACGGTSCPVALAVLDQGLSPRVRGNPCNGVSDGDSIGSIPARAGEPATFSASPSTTKVYPRACGGTEAGGLTWRTANGLSPRVRGNRRIANPTHSRGRSIPARAGEPLAG